MANSLEDNLSAALKEFEKNGTTEMKFPDRVVYTTKMSLPKLKGSRIFLAIDGDKND